MPTVYRICKTKYAATAFDGEGAFRFGGRWNGRSTRMIYTAGSLALALKAADQGAQLIRVHDVPETVQALKVWRGLRDQALTPRIG